MQTLMEFFGVGMWYLVIIIFGIVYVARKVAAEVPGAKEQALSSGIEVGRHFLERFLK